MLNSKYEYHLGNTEEDSEYNYLACIYKDNGMLTVGVFYEEEDANMWAIESIALMKKLGMDDVETEDDQALILDEIPFDDYDKDKKRES